MSIFGNYYLDSIAEYVEEAMKNSEDKEKTFSEIMQAVYYGMQDFIKK